MRIKSLRKYRVDVRRDQRRRLEMRAALRPPPWIVDLGRLKSRRRNWFVLQPQCQRARQQPLAVDGGDLRGPSPRLELGPVGIRGVEAQQFEPDAVRKRSGPAPI